MNVLSEIFGLQNHLSAVQECARALLIFGVALLLVRATGRRTFARWSSLDTIVAVVAGSTFSRALTGSAPLWGTMAAMFVLFAAHWLLGRIVAKNAWFATVLEGVPVMLGEAGQIDEATRLRLSVSQTDLLEALHRKGLEDATGARLIVVEPNGTINVIR
ncbi:MAG TPA: YetF domain-containing protein [Rhizomicrobium sp.]|nr:YetF domain-containing protein [Rhizomicrobium sp.]